MKPNIVYIHSHDTGRFIQPYGFPVETPRLQAFAEESVLFRQAFTTSPTCSPSRGCLLTGQHAHQHGLIGLVHRGFSLNSHDQHLVQLLKKHGYHAVLCGIQHEADDAADLGYDDVRGNNPREDDISLDAVDFIENHSGEPFFLSAGFFETHREFPKLEEGDRINSDYCAPPAGLPDTPEVRQDIARYKKSAELLDVKVGRILDALDRKGLRENTIVICTTDHGPAFPYMKCNLTDLGAGVMLMVRAPKFFEGGSIRNEMVTQLDLFPTLCEMLKVEPPNWLQGKSLLPLLQGKSSALHEMIFAQVNCHGNYEPARSVRTARWKYIRRYVDAYRTGCDGGESHDYLLNEGWDEQPIEPEYLYDLTFDPGEACNLAQDKKHESVLEELKGALGQWMIENEDPLLSGQLKLPAEAKLSKMPPGLE